MKSVPWRSRPLSHSRLQPARLLVPAALVVIFAGLLVLLPNLQPVAAQDAPTAIDGAGASSPLQTPYYLPLVGSVTTASSGEVIPGQYIVVMQDADVLAAQGGTVVSAQVFAASVVATYGGELLFTYDSALDGFAAILPDTAVASLQNDPAIAYVEQDRTVTIDVTQTPATWGIDRIDQRNRPLTGSYTYTRNGAGVHAYIVDTGIHPTHAEFTGRLDAGFTSINDGLGTGDCNGHGTHVAGTTGGTLYGVAKGVTLHPIRVLNCGGSGSISGVIAGLNWVVANHVKPAVANMSLGGSASAALDGAVRNATQAGITFAVAAGNSMANACNYSPARESSAITVGSSTSGDSRSSFSNYGSCVDIFAPGSGITSAWYTANNASNNISGTSMASPHVAGAAALYLEANPAASPAQVAAALIGNATSNILSNAGADSPNLLLYAAFIDDPTAATPEVTPEITPTGTPLGDPAVTPTNTPVPTATSTPVAPPATPTQAPTAAPTATQPPPATCGNLVANPGFEAGRELWTEGSTKGFPLICNGASCNGIAAPARTGTWRSWLAGSNAETSEIRQTVSIPAGSAATLSFWYRVDSTDFCGYDYGYANAIVDGATIQLRRYSLCNATDTNSWVREQLNLSAYAGKTITLAFRAATDSSYQSSLYIDDIALATGAACSTGITLEPDNTLFAEPVQPAEVKPELPATVDGDSR